MRLRGRLGLHGGWYSDGCGPVSALTCQWCPATRCKDCGDNLRRARLLLRTGALTYDGRKDPEVTDVLTAMRKAGARCLTSAMAVRR